MKHLRKSQFATAATITMCLCAPTLFAGQPGMHTMKVSGEDITGQPLELQEPGAVVAQRGGTLEVLFVMEPSMRVEAYRDVDLRAGDVIVMANGKRTDSLPVLEQLVGAAAIGSQIKLGIRRGEEMRVVSYLKADPETLPSRRMMTMKVEADDGSPAKMSMHAEGGEQEQVVMLQGTGLIAKAGDSGPIVGYVLEHAKDVIEGADVQEGDRIVSLQGEEVSDLDELFSAWDAIAIGENVELVLARGGETLRAHFVRPEFDPKGGMTMIKKPGTE